MTCRLPELFGDAIGRLSPGGFRGAAAAAIFDRKVNEALRPQGSTNGVNAGYFNDLIDFFGRERI